MVFPVVMYGCEGWTIKKAEHRRLMLLNCGVGEDSWESLGLQEDPTSPNIPKGNQSWIFVGRTNVEAETPILWPPDEKSWLIGKDPDAGKDSRQEEKRMTEDDMVGWHHWLNGHEFGWTPGIGDGQGGLACCSSWGHKELDTTEWLNWTELMVTTWTMVLTKEHSDMILPQSTPWLLFSSESTFLDLSFSYFLFC